MYLHKLNFTDSFNQQKKKDGKRDRLPETRRKIKITKMCK